ncbi:MAG TPA: RNB domain-containing ribonuclease [Gaiellaceae bacterium]
MPQHSTSSLVVEISRRGRLLIGEPYFTPGVPIVLEAKGSGGVEPGELALVRTGRGRARIERSLGSAARIEDVLEALLVEKAARVEFEPHAAPAAVVEDRVDLRDLLTFTIDPETAKDFDDALSFRRDDDGIRAWVHIADVSYFVGSGSPLDHGAARRSFSTYVPGAVAPMLPHELADDLCSLRPHQDRLCVTVEIPPAGEPRFYRSVIRSDARLTYGQAEAREAPADVVEALELNASLARELRDRRFARGALQVQTPEVVFEFDGDGGVAGARLEGEPRAHMLVEELMILANEHVGAFLASHRLESLYRVHERPDPQAVERLLQKLADLEVPTPPARERLTPEEAGRLAGAVSVRVAEYTQTAGRGREAFPALVLRALKQARYDPRNLGHAGLASTAYCHFTSPIRRYPDLVVHRTLLRELGLADDPPPEDLGWLAEHASEREREAAQVEYLADEICAAWLLERRLFELGWDADWEGEIVGLIGSGVFVRFGGVFEGFLPARRLRGEFFELNLLGTALVGRTTGRRYRLGDAVAVRVESIAKSEGKVELAPGRRPD